MSYSPAVRAASTAPAVNPLVTATMRTAAGSLPASSIRCRRAMTRAVTTSVGGGVARTRAGAEGTALRVAPDEQRLAPLVATTPVGEISRCAHRARVDRHR